MTPRTVMGPRGAASRRHEPPPRVPPRVPPATAATPPRTSILASFSFVVDPSQSGRSEPTDEVHLLDAFAPPILGCACQRHAALLHAAPAAVPFDVAPPRNKRPRLQRGPDRPSDVDEVQDHLVTTQTVLVDQAGQEERGDDHGGGGGGSEDDASWALRSCEPAAEALRRQRRRRPWWGDEALEQRRVRVVVAAAAAADSPPPVPFDWPDLVRRHDVARQPVSQAVPVSLHDGHRFEAPERCVHRLLFNPSPRCVAVDVGVTAPSPSSSSSPSSPSPPRLSWIVPPRSAFLLTDLLRDRLASTPTWTHAFPYAAYLQGRAASPLPAAWREPPNLVLLDPPFPNRSASRLHARRRGRHRRGAATDAGDDGASAEASVGRPGEAARPGPNAYRPLDDVYALWALKNPVRRLLQRPGCLVACWVTNSPKAQRFVSRHLFGAWRVEPLGCVAWVKLSAGRRHVEALRRAGGGARPSPPAPGGTSANTPADHCDSGGGGGGTEGEADQGGPRRGFPDGGAGGDEDDEDDNGDAEASGGELLIDASRAEVSGRRPYELLLLGRYLGEGPDGTNRRRDGAGGGGSGPAECAGPEHRDVDEAFVDGAAAPTRGAPRRATPRRWRKVVASVPLGHSRKPYVLDVLRPLLPPDEPRPARQDAASAGRAGPPARVVELFARQACRGDDHDDDRDDGGGGGDGDDGGSGSEGGRHGERPGGYWISVGDDAARFHHVGFGVGLDEAGLEVGAVPAPAAEAGAAWGEIAQSGGPATE